MVKKVFLPLAELAQEGEMPLSEATSCLAKRKSWASSIAQYAQVIEHGLHRKHYGITSPLLVLWVFNKKSKQEKFLELCKVQSPIVRKSILTNVWGVGSGVRVQAELSDEWEGVVGKQVRLLS